MKIENESFKQLTMFSSKPKKDVKFEPFKSVILEALKQQEVKKKLKQSNLYDDDDVGSLKIQSRK